MKGGNKIGFGFGSAMFAIKDIQDMYGQFDSKPQQIKKAPHPKVMASNPKPIQVKQAQNNKTIQAKDSEKPKLILKTENNTKISSPMPNQQKISLNNQSKKKILPLVDKKLIEQKEQLKINKLESFIVGKNVFELTINSKPSKWSYTSLNDSNTKPAFAMVQNPEISFSLNERNIRQGSIGNCYFICSLAALTQNIEQLRQRIPNYQQYTSKSEYFTVNMFESGKLVTMKVPNLFNQSYSKPINNDITTLVLQKAYAQLYGGYEIMTLGHSIDAFRDLSGNIAEYIDLKNQQKMKFEIMQAFQQSHPMVIASKQIPKNEEISAKHSYNVLSYSEKNKEFFVELRDPRGWTKANFNSPLNLESNRENGEFWVPYKDLIQNFEVITVSRFMKNSLYFYKTFGVKELPQNGSGSISFKINEPTQVSASIHQKHKKFFDQKYQYNVVNIMLCEVDQKMSIIRTLKCNFNSNQVCSLSLNLQKGTYVIVGQIHPFKSNKQQRFPEQVFTLSLNTDKDIKEFSLLSQFNLTRALSLYILSNPEQFKQSISKQNLHRYHGSLFGKVCILYENHSEKNVIEQLQFDVQNVEIKEKKLMLGKSETKLILCPIGPTNNCSHKCSFKSKTYYSK